MRALGVRGGRAKCACAATAAMMLTAMIAAAPSPAAAQAVGTNTVSSGGDLLQPSLQGNPAMPPRFRKAAQAPAERTAPATRFSPPVGAAPVYGSPNGFGAGDTGFDSLNLPRSKRKRPAQTQKVVPGATAPLQAEMTFTPIPSFTSTPPPPPAAPPQVQPTAPEIHPNKAAARTGATLPPLTQPLPVNNPPAEVHPLAASNRPGAVLPVPPPEYYNYAASMNYVAGMPPPTLQPPSTFALGQLPQRLLPIA